MIIEDVESHQPDRQAPIEPDILSARRHDLPDRAEYEAALLALAGVVQARRTREGQRHLPLEESLLVLSALSELKRSGTHAMLMWIESELATLHEFLDRHAALMESRIAVDLRWLTKAPCSGEHQRERLVSRLGLCSMAATG